ncbi:MAG: DMT family protein [Candidatus Sumerlaeaceae bacterium]|nr:DMT family protein [Candidatus Sumerlaeaceae bacterium]
MSTILLLTISNIFMTFAWYGHLRFRELPLWQVILVSWGIAFIEYLFMVPANRLGAQAGWSGFQLKIVQEAITLIVFTFFAIFYLGEKPSWNNFLAFACILAAVALTFGNRLSTH